MFSKISHQGKIPFWDKTYPIWGGGKANRPEKIYLPCAILAIPVPPCPKYESDINSINGFALDHRITYCATSSLVKVSRVFGGNLSLGSIGRRGFGCASSAGQTHRNRLKSIETPKALDHVELSIREVHLSFFLHPTSLLITPKLIHSLINLLHSQPGGIFFCRVDN